ncbi:MBL fold metallo-hydrolase [Wenyingzhuangia aestuarii]|uniref:MBL fold metallo-hydrolase n=1 Tax=Wenyingzhuangia aestuarii TaxID=1647582 RepID=UPI00143BEC03|nr:MBL fold metallo-hydrolase [Wenyingzhuangia aestuarii]NJB83817.1 phosphoribosyl 1,2-cyclic phosphate phosphodiesterase [Wenyingzhuangia aestuarii]
MKVTFLGTGTSQGIPMLLSDEPVNFSTDPKDKRMRSSIFIEWDGFSCLIDCGADFRMQMLANKVTAIDAVLFTHEHSDHIAGLDDIRPFCYKKGPMPVYAMQRVMDSLASRYDYIFTTKNRYPGAAAVLPTIINDVPFVLGNKTITPIKVHHGGLPILGYKIDEFAYLTDVKTLDNSELEKLQNLDVLVINALRIEEHPTHLSLQEAIDLVAVLTPKKAYFTHISHRLGFHEEVSKNLPENVFLSYDGLSIDL